MCVCVLLPRSRVIPLSLLCGFLSKAAVEATELRALAEGESHINNNTCASFTYFDWGMVAVK